MRLKAVISYKGSKYYGWAKQKDTLTIQGEIELVLSKYFNQDINVYASGRTDAGVHALGQVIHFNVNKIDVDLSRCRYSLNMMLTKDIHIISLEKASENFHARYEAKVKTYLYKIYLGENNPFINEEALCIPNEFDISLFKKALDKFNGKHNFQDFTSKEEDEDNFVREIYSITLNQNDNLLEVHISGNGFMRYMVRYIIATCIEIALKKESMMFINEHLDSNIRNVISYKANPCGLYLEKVTY